MVWLVLTVLCQTRYGLSDWIRQRDYLSLIPLWTFFSPNPLQSNINFYYRHILIDGRVDNWTALLPVEPSGMQRLGFNQYRRVRKALVDLTLQFAQEKNEYNDENSLQLSIPYLAWLMAAIDAPHCVTSVGVQFVITATNNFTEVEDLASDALILLSNVHPLSNEHGI